MTLSRCNKMGLFLNSQKRCDVGWHFDWRVRICGAYQKKVLSFFIFLLHFWILWHESSTLLTKKKEHTWMYVFCPKVRLFEDFAEMLTKWCKMLFFMWCDILFQFFMTNCTSNEKRNPWPTSCLCHFQLLATFWMECTVIASIFTIKIAENVENVTHSFMENNSIAWSRMCPKLHPVGHSTYPNPANKKFDCFLNFRELLSK